MSLFKFGFTSHSDKDNKEEKQTKGRAETKQKYEKEKRKCRFLPKWKDDFKWLEYDEQLNKMYCVPGQKYKKEGRFVEDTDN